MIDKSAVYILVVDDEPFMLKLHLRMLAKLGFTSVTVCEGGMEGLNTIDADVTFPDLILLDLNMPGIDGVEFIRHLVARNYPGSLILISGEDERMLQAAEKLVQAHKIEGLGYLRKPVNPDMLAACLAKWKPSSYNRRAAAVQTYGADEVRGAIANAELVNHYQPTISLLTGHTVGVESLVRWQHPKDGMVFPDQFISVAENNGLIQDLTRAVLAHALADSRRWQQETGLKLHVAINVSMGDLEALDFADFIARQTFDAGVSPEQVTLEVTETRLMQDLRAPLEVLTRLRLKRFRISIDDFGTGHSSLAQLRDMPFDELKIDRGFVHRAWSDPKSGAIFDTSVMLAKQLGMKIVAEGVEDRADWDFVRKAKCDAAQGYFIAKPMPADKLHDWIQDWEERVLLLTHK